MSYSYLNKGLNRLIIVRLRASGTLCILNVNQKIFFSLNYYTKG